eukprot:g4060.t1
MKRVKYIGLEEGWSQIHGEGIAILTHMLEQSWAGPGVRQVSVDEDVESKQQKPGGVLGTAAAATAASAAAGGGAGSDSGAGLGIGALGVSGVMSCRVCGSEVEPEEVECSMCGSSIVVQRYQRVLKQAFSKIYATCYSMCSQREPYNWQEQLYERHGKVLRDYLVGKVMPRLRAARGEVLLERFLQAKTNHELMTRWMAKFFMFLDRYLVKDRNLPTLREVGEAAFEEHVFQPIKASVQAALVDVVNREREGGPLGDRLLVRGLATVFEGVKRVGDADAFVFSSKHNAEAAAAAVAAEGGAGAGGGAAAAAAAAAGDGGGGNAAGNGGAAAGGEGGAAAGGRPNAQQAGEGKQAGGRGGAAAPAGAAPAGAPRAYVGMDLMAAHGTAQANIMDLYLRVASFVPGVMLKRSFLVSKPQAMKDEVQGVLESTSLVATVYHYVFFLFSPASRHFFVVTFLLETKEVVIQALAVDQMSRAGVGQAALTLYTVVILLSGGASFAAGLLVRRINRFDGAGDRMRRRQTAIFRTCDDEFPDLCEAPDIKIMYSFSKKMGPHTAGDFKVRDGCGVS